MRNDLGALILKRCFNIHGYTKQGITCYNGKIANNPYGQEVLEILAKAGLNLATGGASGVVAEGAKKLTSLIKNGFKSTGMHTGKK